MFSFGPRMLLNLTKERVVQLGQWSGELDRLILEEVLYNKTVKERKSIHIK